MTLKAISFLGYTPPDRPYREAIYRLDGQECATTFMAEATVRFFKGDLDGYDTVRLRGREQPVHPAMRAAARERLSQSLWEGTRDLRNDLGHTGMRANPRLAARVKEQVASVCGRLPALLQLLEPRP